MNFGAENVGGGSGCRLRGWTCVQFSSCSMMGAARVVNRSFPGQGNARPLLDRGVRFCRPGLVARAGSFSTRRVFCVLTWARRRGVSNWGEWGSVAGRDRKFVPAESGVSKKPNRTGTGTLALFESPAFFDNWPGASPRFVRASKKFLGVVGWSTSTKRFSARAEKGAENGQDYCRLTMRWWCGRRPPCLDHCAPSTPA